MPQYRGIRPKAAPDRWDGVAAPATYPPTLADPNFEVPPVFGGGSGSGAVRVDTHALIYFADMLDKLLEPIGKAVGELKRVNVRPGNFAAADRIVERVSGPAGLKKTYSDNLIRLRDGLMLLGKRLRELAKKYDTIEELNGAGATEVAALIGEVGGVMPQLGAAK